mgnify:CR=1 FL=1
MRFGSLDFNITNNTNIKNSTNGKMALTPVTISIKGVWSQTVAVAATPPVDTAAAALISSGVTVKERKIARISTAKIGKSEAIVTTPKPDKEDSPLPAALAIPIPKESTKGTVTGPVVTAPQGGV